MRGLFFVGFVEHCGDSLTHMVPDADTLKIIYRSALRPRTINKVLTPKHTNSVGWRVEPNLALLWMLSWQISIKQQQQMLLKRLKILNNQP